MTIKEARPDDLEVDLHSLARALFRSLRFLLPLALLVAVATYFGLSLLSPQYKGEAKILIETSESAVTRPSTTDSAETQAMLDQEGVMSQVQLVNSRELAKAVAAKLDLGRIAEFDPVLRGPGLVSGLLQRVGLARDPASTPAEERVLQSYFEKLSVYPIEKSRVIVVEFTALDPELAARVANAIAEQYLVFQQEAKRDANQDATNWLDAEIADLRLKVRDAEARVEAYRTSSDLLGGAGENGTTLAQQTLVELNAELTRVRAARADAEAKASQIRAGLQSGAALNSMDVLRSELIQRLSEQAVGLRAQVAQLSATLLPGHPRIRELNAQLADLDAQIKREAGKILTGIENEARLAAAREAEILASLDRQKETASRSNDSSVQLRALEREAGAQRALLETYLRQYREALARQNGNYLPANARIISRAAAPVQPSFPKKGPMAAAAFMAALLVGVSIVVLRELAMRKPVHALRYAEAPALPAGGRPASGRWADDRRVRRMMARDTLSGPPLTAPAERSLASIARRVTDIGASRVVVAAIDKDFADGRPLAAVTLARVLAKSGKRSVLLDFNTDGANPDAMSDNGAMPGFGDLYAGEVSFAQVIFRDRASTAHFIPAGRRPLPEGWKDDPQFETLIDALDHTYDVLVIDADSEALAVLGPTAEVIVLVTDRPPGDPETAKSFSAIAQSVPAEVILLVADAEEELEGAAA